MTNLVPVAEVVQGEGVGLSLTGMCVVFFALTLLSLFIAILPRVVALLDRYFPPVEDHMVVDAAVSLATEDREVVAVMAAFITHLESGQDSRTE